MSFDLISQKLVINFIVLMTSGVFLLLAYRLLFDRPKMQKHLGLLRFLIGFLFMCSYAYGVNVVNSASSDLEDLGKDNGFLRRDVYDKIEHDCFKAWSRDLSHLTEASQNSLAPCMAFLSREAEKNKHQNEFKSVMPTGLFSNLLAFFGAFHGGLAAAFFYAWATTPRPRRQEEFVS
jgi:hypothetical protein